MRAFTAARDAATPDEIWLCEHAPVYTQGLAGRAEHVLQPGAIEVVQTQRGGQVTYHGPGQVVAYTLFDLRRQGIYVREFVHRLESAVLQTLSRHGITGHRVRAAPGVYVRLADPFGHQSLTDDEANGRAWHALGKVAALGIKVSRHCTFHGVALNVDMDLAPFAGINPCGYSGLASVDLARLGVSTHWDTVAAQLAQRLQVLLRP